MTRPIYEPSLPRKDAELDYGSRQLFRRPAPLNEGLIWEPAWGWRHGPSGGPLSISDNTTTNLNSWATSDVKPGQTKVDVSVANGISLDGGVMFLVTLQIDWQDDWAGETYVMFGNTAGILSTTTADILYLPSGTAVFRSQTSIHSWPFGGTVFANVRQVSGMSRNISDIRLNAVEIGEVPDIGSGGFWG
jgi:hypothetical protein